MMINLKKCERCWPPGSGSNHGDEQSVIILSWKLMAEKGENGPELSPQQNPEDPPSFRSVGSSLTL